MLPARKSPRTNRHHRYDETLKSNTCLCSDWRQLPQGNCVEIHVACEPVGTVNVLAQTSLKRFLLHMHAGWGTRSSVDSSSGGDSAAHLALTESVLKGWPSIWEEWMWHQKREVVTGGWCREMSIGLVFRLVDYTWSTEAGGRCSCLAFLKTGQSEVSWLLWLVCAAMASGVFPHILFLPFM